MNILFTRFPLESAAGGAETQTSALMRVLKERGHEVRFAGSCPVLLETSSKASMVVTEMNIGMPPVTPWLAFSFLWRQFSMKRQLQELLASHGNGLNAIVMLSLSEKLLLTQPALDAGLAVYWLEHDRVGRWLTHNPWLPRLRRLSRRVKTIVVSELSKQMYVKLGWNSDDVVTIPNGIAASWFSEKAALNTTAVRVGCVARMTHDKGVDVVLRAISGLPDRVELHLVGEGRDQGEVESLIDTLQLNRRVHWLPKADDLKEFYQSVHMLVLPSRDHDPFGLVVAEAMAAETPVIVTSVCGIASYLTDGVDALIVPPDSHSALEGAIAVLADPLTQKRLSEAGKKTAMERFTLEKMVDRYETLFTKNGH